MKRTWRPIAFGCRPLWLQIFVLPEKRCRPSTHQQKKVFLPQQHIARVHLFLTLFCNWCLQFPGGRQIVRRAARWTGATACQASVMGDPTLVSVKKVSAAHKALLCHSPGRTTCCAQESLAKSGANQYVSNPGRFPPLIRYFW